MGLDVRRTGNRAILYGEETRDWRKRRVGDLSR